MVTEHSHHPRNQKYVTTVYCIAVNERPNRGTNNIYKNMVKFGHAVFQMCKRTDKQTDMVVAILRTPTGAEVIMSRKFRKTFAHEWAKTFRPTHGQFDTHQQSATSSYCPLMPVRRHPTLETKPLVRSSNAVFHGRLLTVSGETGRERLRNARWLDTPPT